MDSLPNNPAAFRLAFRLALLDAVPKGGTLPVRQAALQAARNRLASFLSRSSDTGDLPSALQGIRDRAALAAALEAGFEEAREILAQSAEEGPAPPE